jgi:hypothetical protein
MKNIQIKVLQFIQVGEKESQAWNDDWNFIHKLSKIQRGLCMTSQGGGGMVKKCGVNMESEGHVPYAIVLHRNITIFKILRYYK